jgi:putative pre-16S rRNA nuclease
MARIVAIDFGKKRVGLAIADPLGMFAQPMGTFSPNDAVQRLEKLQRDEGIEAAVIGWPLLPDGTEGEATRFVTQYMNRLLNRIPNINIVKWDERYSSSEARDRIKSGPDPSLKKRGKGRIDVAAAGIILEDYLASR